MCACLYNIQAWNAIAQLETYNYMLKYARTISSWSLDETVGRVVEGKWWSRQELRNFQALKILTFCNEL